MARRGRGRRENAATDANTATQGSASWRVLAEEITYPAVQSPELMERLLRGDDVPDEVRGNKAAVRGDVVADIPECSLDVLLGIGAIEAVGGDAETEDDGAAGDGESDGAGETDEAEATPPTDDGDAETEDDA